MNQLCDYDDDLQPLTIQSKFEGSAQLNDSCKLKIGTQLLKGSQLSFLCIAVSDTSHHACMQLLIYADGQSSVFSCDPHVA